MIDQELREKNCYDIDELNKKLLNPEQIIKENEISYENALKNISNCIIDENIKMVLIAGPSSSGKTTTANILSQYLKQLGKPSIVVSIDDFFFNNEDTPLLPDGTPDFEGIGAVDVETFNKFFVDLLKTGKSNMPHFNFQTHRRDRFDEVSFSKNEILIVEGLHALNPQLIKTHEFDEKIFKVYACVDSIYENNGDVICLPTDIRLMRRTYRDAFSRSTPPNKTFELWKNVIAGEKINIEPYKGEADVFIDTTRAYEIAIYAKYLPVLLEKYKDKTFAKNLLNILELVEPIDKKLIPETSLLWEFLVNKE